MKRMAQMPEKKATKKASKDGKMERSTKSKSGADLRRAPRLTGM